MAGSVAVIWPVSFCGQATQRNLLSRAQYIPSPGPNSVAIPIGWALQAVAETPYPLRSLGRDSVSAMSSQLHVHPWKAVTPSGPSALPVPSR